MVVAGVRIWSASALRYKRSLKAEGRMSLDCEPSETGVVVGSAGLVSGQAMTAHVSLETGTHSSSVMSWVCEAVARAVGRVVEARTFGS